MTTATVGMDEIMKLESLKGVSMQSFSEIGSSKAYKVNEIIMGMSSGASKIASKVIAVNIKLNTKSVLLSG